MNEFWDDRYAQIDYAYGTKPNAFFKKQIDQLTPGRLLLPAEGEGRNAVYAAHLGWEVYAFDISEEGRKKALKLADRVGVEITYETGDFSKLVFGEQPFDLVAFIFAHVDPKIRWLFHGSLISYLKPGGKLILEGFSKDQYTRSTGGPKNPDMLFSSEDLKSDFSKMSRVRVWEKEVLLNEGDYHQGLSAVIRATGVM